MDRRSHAVGRVTRVEDFIHVAGSVVDKGNVRSVLTSNLSGHWRGPTGSRGALRRLGRGRIEGIPDPWRAADRGPWGKCARAFFGRGGRWDIDGPARALVVSGRPWPS